MKPSPILVQTVAGRLNEAIGVDPRGLDASRLGWIVAARCRHLNLPDPSAYAPYLDSNPGELDALIDDAVVGETRFFRDPTVFEHIRQTLAHLGKTVTGPLRLLSAPCGSGEEAYSLAAMPERIGLHPARFSIDAFDVSNAALEAARNGVYPERAMSQVPVELQQVCAHRIVGQWHVQEWLRERVQFARVNLAQPGALGATPRYHVILCRNLFIYLDPEARAALAQSLAAALLPQGRLFLGTADRVEELNALFAPVRPAASFAFVHRAGAPAATPRLAVPVRRALATLHRKKLLPARPVLESPPRPADPPAPDTPAAEELLRRALEHQQRGELAKAERRCRQALYLAPNLLPALELLQSLWNENPNLRLRRALRDRILRNRLPRTLAPDVQAPGVQAVEEGL